MCPPDIPYDTFISHNQLDQDAARFLERQLVAEGFHVFLAERELVPGTSLPSELARAIEASLSFTLLAGPSGIAGYQKLEIDMAAHRRTTGDSFRIVVVILPGGDASTLPLTVQPHLRIDFSNGLQDAPRFTQLIGGIIGEVSDLPGKSGPPAYRSMAAPIEDFVQRPELSDILRALTGVDDERATATPVCLTTALRGAGGFGKTALAQAICQDDLVRRRFPAGILWTTLGQDLREADRLTRILDLLKWWLRKEPPRFDSVEAAAAYLRHALSGKRVLLVIDDLWRATDFRLSFSSSG